MSVMRMPARCSLRISAARISRDQREVGVRETGRAASRPDRSEVTLDCEAQPVGNIRRVKRTIDLRGDAAELGQDFGTGRLSCSPGHDDFRLS